MSPAVARRGKCGDQLGGGLGAAGRGAILRNYPGVSRGAFET